MNKALTPNQLMLTALFVGFFLNYFLPFTYKSGDLITKNAFSFGNPIATLPYAFLVFILFSTVSKKDIKNKGKVVLDKPKDIPKTIFKSVLEIVFGIIFIFLVPLIGGAFLFWSGISIRLVVLACIIYTAILVYLGKKYYWKNLYK